MFWFVSLFSRGSVPATTPLRFLSLILPLYLVSLGLLSLSLGYFGGVIECYPSHNRFFINNFCMFQQYAPMVTDLIYYRCAPVLYLLFGFVLAFFPRVFPKPYFSSEFTKFNGLMVTEEHAIRLRLLSMLTKQHAVRYYCGYVLKKTVVYMLIGSVLIFRLYSICFLLGLSPFAVLRRDTVRLFFPYVTNCQLAVTGASGTIQREDYYCSLSMNEWYYFSFYSELMFYSFFALLFCFKVFASMVFVVPYLRLVPLLLLPRGHSIPTVLQLHKVLNYKEWFMTLSLLSKLPPSISVDLLEDLLAERLGSVTPIV